MRGKGGRYRRRREWRGEDRVEDSTGEWSRQQPSTSEKVYKEGREGRLVQEKKKEDLWGT